LYKRNIGADINATLFAQMLLAVLRRIEKKYPSEASRKVVLLSTRNLQ